MTRRSGPEDPKRPVHVRTWLDPDRRRRGLSPDARLDEHIEDFIGWIIAGGFSPAAAKWRADWIQKYHLGTGKDSPALTLEEKAAAIAEFDRQLDELGRQEAEDLADVDPDEPEH